MAVNQADDRLRLKRLRSEKAIQLAMQNRWQEAIELNRQVLELFPDDVDTHNRLGKALMELGQYRDARDAYSQAARRDPSNTIARKNLERLSKLAKDEVSAAASAPPPSPVDPRLFIEESGKTAVTNLVDRPRFELIATLTAGDKAEIQVAGGVVRVVSSTGQVVGQLEPKIAQRVLRLTQLGNKYGAAITSIDESHVRVIIREVFRHPSMGARPSFPTQAPEIRPYTKESVFRADMDDDDDDSVDESESDTDSGDTADVNMEDRAVADDADAADEH